MDFFIKIRSARKKIIEYFLKKIEKNNNNSFLEQPLLVIKFFSGFIVISSSAVFLWLSLAKTEQIIQVNGRLEPRERVRSVQIPEKGIIKELFVSDGEYVEEGQLLLTINTDLVELNLNSIKDQIEISKQVLNEKLSQKSLTENIFSLDIKKTKEEIEIQEEIFEKLENIYLEGAISKLNFYDQKIKLLNLKGKLDKLILDGQRELSQLVQDENKISIQINNLNKELQEYSNLKNINQIKSPITGYILDLNVISDGYVAKSTETILKIVPADNLMAIIQINSSDIGFVEINQDVDISINTFPAKDFGSLGGNITSISSSSLTPKDERMDSYFVAKVKLDNQFLNTKKGADLKLKPGMSLKANIILREDSYLNILLGNFKDKTESIRRN